MKINLCYLIAAAALALAGCAAPGPGHQVAAGSSSAAFDGYAPSSGQDAAHTSSLPDYRRILADPGPF